MGTVIFLIFLLFSNIITEYIPFDFVRYWDELLFIISVFYWCVRTERKIIDKNKFRILVILGIVIISGFISNIVWCYQVSVGAIIRDIVGFLKFPITFLLFLKFFSYQKYCKSVYKIVPFLKAYLMVLLVLGLVSMFVDTGMCQEEVRGGIHPFMFLYVHPTFIQLESSLF